jgi:hypothetical protein
MLKIVWVLAFAAMVTGCGDNMLQPSAVAATPAASASVSADTVVWGTLDEDDNIVWGTVDDENIVWGTLR